MSLVTLILVCSFAPAPPPRTDKNNGYLGVDFLPGPEELTIGTLYTASPAMEAGLTRGDVIVACDGMRVHTVADLGRVLRKKKPDTQVVFTVRRAGEELPFKVKLGKQFAAHLGVTWGGGSLRVIALARESPARDAGVQVGDTLLSIDGKSVAVPPDLTEYLKDKKPGEVVMLVIRRATGDVKVELKLGKRPGL
jgi:S1-C subfamily serine protease